MELDGVENEMVDATLAAFVLDQSIIGTSGMSAPNPVRPNIDLREQR